MPNVLPFPPQVHQKPRLYRSRGLWYVIDAAAFEVPCECDQCTDAYIAALAWCAKTNQLVLAQTE